MFHFFDFLLLLLLLLVTSCELNSTPVVAYQPCSTPTKGTQISGARVVLARVNFSLPLPLVFAMCCRKAQTVSAFPSDAPYEVLVYGEWPAFPAQCTVFAARRGAAISPGPVSTYAGLTPFVPTPAPPPNPPAPPPPPLAPCDESNITHAVQCPQHCVWFHDKCAAAYPPGLRCVNIFAQPGSAGNEANGSFCVESLLLREYHSPTAHTSAPVALAPLELVSVERSPEAHVLVPLPQLLTVGGAVFSQFASGIVHGGGGNTRWVQTPWSVCATYKSSSSVFNMSGGGASFCINASVTDGVQCNVVAHAPLQGMCSMFGFPSLTYMRVMFLYAMK